MSMAMNFAFWMFAIAAILKKREEKKEEKTKNKS